MNSHSSAWSDVNTVEELLIMVCALDERRQAIKVMAWHESSFKAIYAEVAAMQRDIAYVRDVLHRQYLELQERARREA